ncbi:MAG: hypothetical protein R3F11_17015 [Verrucomicrobiales bacterium]
MPRSEPPPRCRPIFSGGVQSWATSTTTAEARYYLIWGDPSQLAEPVELALKSPPLLGGGLVEIETADAGSPGFLQGQETVSELGPAFGIHLHVDSPLSPAR